MKKFLILIWAFGVLSGCASTRQAARIEDRGVLDSAAVQKIQDQVEAKRRQEEAARAQQAREEAERQAEVARRAEEEQLRARRIEEERIRREQEEQERILAEQARRLAEEQARAEMEESRRRAEEVAQREMEASQRRAQEERLLEEQKRLARELEDFQRALEPKKSSEVAAPPAGAGRVSGAEAVVATVKPESPIAGKSQTDPWGELQDPAGPLSRRSIYFAYDQYTIDGEQMPIVEAHAKFLAANPKFSVSIEGNCDDRGSREYNLSLGSRRAESVRRAMLVLGVAASNMSTVSFGAEKPLALGQDEESWAKNRRSDIVYADEPR